jgi:hypothetical protein
MDLETGTRHFSGSYSYYTKNDYKLHGQIRSSAFGTEIFTRWAAENLQEGLAGKRQVGKMTLKISISRATVISWEVSGLRTKLIKKYDRPIRLV